MFYPFDFEVQKISAAHRAEDLRHAEIARVARLNCPPNAPARLSRVLKHLIRRVLAPQGVGLFKSETALTRPSRATN